MSIMISVTYVMYLIRLLYRGGKFAPYFVVVCSVQLIIHKGTTLITKIDANLRKTIATHRNHQTGFIHAMIYDLVYAHRWLKFKTKLRMSVDKGDSLFTLCFSMSSIQNFG